MKNCTDMKGKVAVCVQIPYAKDVYFVGHGKRTGFIMNKIIIKIINNKKETVKDDVGSH